MQKHKISIKSLASKPIIIPLAALLLLVIFNLINDYSFFAIKWGQNAAGGSILTGSIISILDEASELAILAIGMTLVTAASGGQDISVGAGIAITGSATLKVIFNPNFGEGTAVILAILMAVLAGVICGAFNGVLVSAFKIPPMVATLILFTAGRSIGSWILGGGNDNATNGIFLKIGQYIPGVPIPTSILVTAAVVIIFALIFKFTNLKLYMQAVGINSQSSRLNGLNPTMIKFLSFVILGVCVGICGVLNTSRIGTINHSSCAKDIEMDAILAVALGGNALSGGKFSVTGAILGAYIIQFLQKTLYKIQVPASALYAFKAVVVIVLVIFSAPVVRESISRNWKKLTSKKSSKEVA